MSALVRPPQWTPILEYLDGCSGKAKFPTRAAADGVQKRRKRRGMVGKAYRCRHCGGFHLGRGDGPPG